MIGKDKDGFDVDMSAIFCMQEGVVLYVLAAPHEYRSLQRPVEPEVILKLLDVWIARGERVARGDEVEGTSITWFRHSFDVELARKLRALVAAWTPPELPVEIVEAARAIFRTMGREQPRPGVSWDDYVGDYSDGRTLESYLPWSEGFDEVLGVKEATDAEMAARDLERRGQIAKWLKDIAR